MTALALQIRALHLVAQIEQHLGDAAHAAAADADQVNAMNAAHAIVHARARSARRACTGPRAAPPHRRCARPRAASAILSSRARSAVSSPIDALKRLRRQIALLE